MTRPRRTIVFAGGGSGGHIFPNLAIWQYLAQQRGDLEPHFVIANRPLDVQLVSEQQLSYTCLPVQPLKVKPWKLPGWYRDFRRSVRLARELMVKVNAAAVVGTGGFVSGPTMIAGRKSKLPTAMVNLDAVPGRANRMIARRAAKLFTVAKVPSWKNAVQIGMPLRDIALGQGTQAANRERLGLQPDRPTLLVCGGSQGAATLNKMMIALVQHPQNAGLLRPWQIIHLCGANDQDTLRDAYQAAGQSAVVLGFCQRMGMAWRAADLALSRAGASSVAEAWANAVPTIFLPYPFHRDQHQKLNARPMAEVGGAIILDDLIDADANANRLATALPPLLEDAARRDRMAAALKAHEPTNGAAAVAQWLAQIVPIEH